MELQNATRFPAMLFRAGIDDDRMAAAVFARVTYDLRGRQLVPAEEQVWPVSAPPWNSPYGPMDSDEVFYRGGVDVFVFGSARAPGGVPAPRVDVVVQVGSSFTRYLTVHGERRWVRHGGGLMPSAPVPFRELPLTLENAFGGTDSSWDELPVPFSANPAGKGFYLSADSAENQPLPHIEDPAAFVRSWEDRPDPVGTASTTMTFGPRVLRGVKLDEQTRAITVTALLFNAAFPALVVPTVTPGVSPVSSGEGVRVYGVHPGGPIEFALPDPPLYTRLSFGNELHEKELYIDQIGIEPDAARVFIAYRYPFRYTLHPMQTRSCELLCRAP